MEVKGRKRELTREELVRGFRNLGLTDSDTVLVQGSYISFRNVSGGPETIIQALLEVLLPGGTLIMPAFNWTDFGEKKRYSKRNTKPQTGVLSEIMMSWEGCRRIYHPLHAFSIIGKQAAELSMKIKNESSFESGSLFGELHRQNAKLMLLGVNYGLGLTFFHYVEESVGVPYRKYLTLHGEVEELDGTVHVEKLKYYGRLSMQQKYNLDKLQPVLEGPGNSLVISGKIGMASVRIMKAAEVYDRIAGALKENPNLVLA